jgi:hypothetical protein
MKQALGFMLTVRVYPFRHPLEFVLVKLLTSSIYFKNGPVRVLKQST